MEINNKFECGELAYAIGQKKAMRKCNSCEEGFIYFKDKAFKCPDCKGTGEVHSGLTVWDIVEEPVQIGAIRATIGNDYCNIKYRIANHSRIRNRPEKHLFKTKDEALQKCDEYNISKMSLVEKVLK